MIKKFVDFLPCSVYRDALIGDCTNGGVSAKHTRQIWNGWAIWGIEQIMGRKKLPNELKAKNWTIKVYDKEKEVIKQFIKEMRCKMKSNKLAKPRTEEEMKAEYLRAYDDDLIDESYKGCHSAEFKKRISDMIDRRLSE